jgi:hypothetical protein
MRAISLFIIILVALVASGFSVPYLSSEQLLYLFIPPMLICILCGWLLVFQSKGLRRSKGVKEFLLYGFIAPVFSNWSKPIPLSGFAQLLFISAAVPAGAILRIIWLIAHA